MKKVLKNKGITMIALIITIIIMLILAGVTIKLTIGEEGVITRAKYAGETYSNAEKDEEEMIKEFVRETDNILAGNLGTSGNTTGGGSSGGGGGNTTSSVLDLYDSTGNIDGKLHVGDFVNYSVGEWTVEDFNLIKSNYPCKLGVSGTLPVKTLYSGTFTFGGFGDSKDSNAVAYDEYGYPKNSEGNDIEGWRVFDVDENSGEIMLVSAGCPEDFYFDVGSDSKGFISQYVLTGRVHEYANATTLKLGNRYKMRDWSMYVDENFATGASCLGYEELDAWAQKYLNLNKDEIAYNGLMSVIGSRFQTLICVNTRWWLGSCGEMSGGRSLPEVSAGHFGLGISSSSSMEKSMGIRVLVSLKSDVLLSSERTGTITVVDPLNKGNDVTYNVWSLM